MLYLQRIALTCGGEVRFPPAMHVCRESEPSTAFRKLLHRIQSYNWPRLPGIP